MNLYRKGIRMKLNLNININFFLSKTVINLQHEKTEESGKIICLVAEKTQKKNTHSNPSIPLEFSHRFSKQKIKINK